MSGTLLFRYSSLVFSLVFVGVITACHHKTKPPTAVLSSEDSIKKRLNIRDSVPPAIRLCTELFPVDTSHLEGLRAGVFSVYRWKWQPEQPRELRVTFLDGLVPVQNRVKAIAVEWERFTNAKFIYVPNGQPADIKISFAKRGVSWSYIGTDSRNHTPSMNFGWLEEEQVDSLFRSVVLHEFGHAIGLVHEHQLPNGNPIKWNVDSVYAYYMGYPNYWEVKDIDENIFKRYRRDQLLGGEYDPKSIMMYHIPKSLTTNDYETPLNVRLSDNDKKIVADVYRR